MNRIFLLHFGVYFVLLLKPDFLNESELLLKRTSEGNWTLNELTAHEAILILARTKVYFVCCGDTGFAEVSSRVPFYFNGVRISPCVFVTSFLTTVWKTMVNNCHNCQEEKLERALNIRVHIFSTMVLMYKNV